MQNQAYIRNIEHGKVLQLAKEISAPAGQMVNKTLARNDAVSVKLFAFSKGTEIGTHTSTGDAMVTVLEGNGKLAMDGKEYHLSVGEVLVIPANKPHSVHAEEAFKMLLIIVFPNEK